MCGCCRRAATGGTAVLYGVEGAQRVVCGNGVEDGLHAERVGAARLDDESVVAAATEEEIYAALGMDWMQAEMRENLGEIEAAASMRFPG